jgi:hypothetical protein
MLPDVVMKLCMQAMERKSKAVLDRLSNPGTVLRQAVTRSCKTKDARNKTPHGQCVRRDRAKGLFRRHQQGLGFKVRAHAPSTHLAAEPGVLEATERCAWFVGERVDEYAARVDLARHALALFEVLA